MSVVVAVLLQWLYQLPEPLLGYDHYNVSKNSTKNKIIINLLNQIDFYIEPTNFLMTCYCLEVFGEVLHFDIYINILEYVNIVLL